MLILVVDTAGSAGGVLLARSETASPNPNETEVLGVTVLEPREFSTQLVSGVAELLRSSGLAITAVDAFAVVCGPGSFTGLRVGLSAVKAMAEVTGRPVIGLSRLAIMASMGETAYPWPSDAGPVHAVLDAGRGEFYHGIYRDAGRTCVAETLDTTAALAESMACKPGLLLVLESAVSSSLPDFAPCLISSPTVAEALPLALADWRARRFQDVASLDANYLRRIDPGGGSRLVGVPRQAIPAQGRP